MLSYIEELWLIEGAKCCNCAGCGCLLLGECHRVQVQLALAGGRALDDLPPLVAGRRKRRPYCGTCIDKPTYGPSPLSAAYQIWKGLGAM